MKGVYERPNGLYQARVWEHDGSLETVGTFQSPEEAAYRRKVYLNGHHWEGMKHDPENYWGFIYLVEDTQTGMKYVGRKQYRLWDGPTGGYKCTDPRDPEWFTEIAWRENDWKLYTGSCEPLNKEISRRGVHNFRFSVLNLAPDKLSLHLMEIEELVRRDVLEAVDSNGDYLYYNANIASQEFRAPFRKKDIKVAESITNTDVKKYYLRPSMCRKCGGVMLYPGDGRCTRCNS